MIVIRSSLSEEELDKRIAERSGDKISLNLAWLATHNLDGSRKYGANTGEKKPLPVFSNKGKLKEDIEAHDELNPKLWNGDKLKPEVKEKIDQIVYQFLSNLEDDAITMVVKDVVLIGSNCSYNYTKDSDLDIHIIAENIEAPDDLYTKIYSAYRSIFNGKFDIDFYGIPVEIYVETEGAPRVSNGVYSVQNDEWIVVPTRETIPEIDKEAFEKELKIWEDRYNKIVEGTKKELDESSTVSIDKDLNQNFQKLINDFPGDAIEIELYTCSNGHNYSIEYIQQLLEHNFKLCGKLLYSISVFKQLGVNTREPFTKVVSNDGIYEIRAKESSNITRCLFFYVIGNKAIITNGFTKKQDKTPAAEIEKARKIRADYYNQRIAKDEINK